MQFEDAITVPQINSYIKAVMDMDVNLRNLFISGEISNLKVHYSTGHIYFSLKESDSILKVIMFASNASRLGLNICNGMKVVVKGSIRCYEVSGQYQLYAEKIYLEGLGKAYLNFENLKFKLFQEGIFEESRKRDLPKYPKKLGIVTSSVGSVIEDIKKVIGRRYPLCEMVLYSVNVQGKNAATQIVKGIKYFNESECVDVVIIGRGGGSSEDLSAFNSEIVAREIYNSKVPIISAVGHETDFTLCDLAADKRASTPSVAAEIAVPDRKVLNDVIEDYKKRLRSSIEFKITFLSPIFNTLQKRLIKVSPKLKIDDKNKYLCILKNNLLRNVSYLIAKKELRFEALNKRLESYSSVRILKQGYALISVKNRKIKSIKELETEKQIKITMQDGSMKFKIIKI